MNHFGFTPHYVDQVLKAADKKKRNNKMSYDDQVAHSDGWPDEKFLATFRCISKRCKGERQILKTEAAKLTEPPSCPKCFMPMILVNAETRR